MGSEWPGFASGLMELSVIRDSVQRSAEVLEEVDYDLFQLIRQPVVDDIVSALISITVIQIALVDLFRELDISPDGIVGHSLGEIACAYCDGGLDRRHTLLSIYWRAKLSNDLDTIPGVMAVVGMDWDECRERCPPDVFAACHNSQDLVTISGEVTATRQFMDELIRDGIFVREVNSYGIAFHCPHVGNVSDILLERIKHELCEPRVRSERWISSSLPEDQWSTDLAKYCSAEYFRNNMSSSVLFLRGHTSHPKQRHSRGDSAASALRRYSQANTGTGRRVRDTHETEQRVGERVDVVVGDRSAVRARTQPGRRTNSTHGCHIR